MDSAYIAARITATKAQIEAYEAAALALGTDGVQSYQLDTGQTITRVTTVDLEWMQKSVDMLYNRCATLEARLNGAGFMGSPAW